MLRLARQRGGGMLGRRSSGRRRHRRQRRCQRGGGKFSAAKVPIFGTLGTGYQIGKFLMKEKTTGGKTIQLFGLPHVDLIGWVFSQKKNTLAKCLTVTDYH